jgi:hypothetical protein
LPIWGIEPQVGNADAGTRRPQVRTRPPIRQTNLNTTKKEKRFVFTTNMV